MSNATVPQLPNPFTPLAFFPPEAARQTTVFYYVSVGALAVLVWDVLNNTAGDLKLVTQHRLNSTTIIYLLARWSTLVYLVTNVIEYTAPLGDCRTYGIRTGWLYPFSIGVTALLFLIRVHAIYNRNKLVTGFFFIAWLGVVGGAALIPIVLHSAQIGPTAYCFTDAVNIPDYISACGALLLFYDTSIYLAISWRLTWVLYSGRTTSTSTGIGHLLTGKNLPMFSKGLLQDGQIYYLSTAGVNLMSVVLFNMHSLPLAYRFLLGVPNQVLMNIMACRVYRNTRTGLQNYKSTLIPTSQASPHSHVHSHLRETPAVTINFTKTTTVDNGDRDVELEMGAMTPTSTGKHQSF